MKKILILTLLCLSVFCSISAQSSSLENCYSGGIANIIPRPTTAKGLSPSDSFLECIFIGSPIDDTLYFTNYDTLLYAGTPVFVDSLIIDSIYLPRGLCWQTSMANNSFLPGESGAIHISGIITSVASDSAGQYKIGMYIRAYTSMGIILGNAEKSAGLAYRIRIVDFHHCCPTIDNSQTDSAYTYLPYAGDPYCDDGINELRPFFQLSITPNPFTSSALLNFESDEEGPCLLKIQDIPGAVVLSEKVEIKWGHHEVPIERDGLNAGLYLLSLQNKNGMISKKLIIE